ncbi:hypothetical protein PFISCL1PPCAC_18487, partial [Pristionchus fissidentatus]
SIQPFHPSPGRMSSFFLLSLLSLLTISHAHFTQCPPSLAPKELGIVGVWKSDDSLEYRISDEDLSIRHHSLLKEGSKTVLLPRDPGDCPVGLCLIRLDLNKKNEGTPFYEENLFGAVNSISDDSTSQILCAREEGDCGAQSPVYVHHREINGSRVFGYTMNGGTQLEGYTRDARPLCYAWTRPSSVITTDSNSSSNACIEMRNVDNGKISYTSESSSGLHSIGTSASLSCSTSFVSAGHALAICTGNGWYPTNGLGPCLRQPASPISASALVGECAMLNEKPYGKLIYSTQPRTSRFGSGTTVSLMCDLGYAPAGETTSTCIDGTWTKSLSECFQFSSFKCLPPFPILNGKISYFFPARTPFSHGSLLQLECQEGFLLEGRDLISCTPQGWTPPALGVCRQNSVQCPILSLVPGGKISYTLPMTPTAQGSTAVLVCAEGTVPHGSLSTVCLNGQWTNSLGTCGSSMTSVQTAGTNCLIINPIVNGRISYSLGEINGAFPPGTTATPYCQSGYNLYGSQVATCLPTGQWTTRTLGNCGPGLPNECPEYNSTETVINYNLPTGRQGYRRESTIATMSCPLGQPDGNVVSTCVAGKWSPPFGQCVTPRQKCTGLSTPIGGSLQYSNGMVEGPFPSGTLVKLNCNVGSLRGSGIVECRDGLWQSEGGDSMGNCGQSDFAPTGNGLGDSFGSSTPSTGSHTWGSGTGSDGDGDLMDGSSGVARSGVTTSSCLAPLLPLGASLSYSTAPSLGVYNSGTLVSLQCPGSSPIGSSQSQCSNALWNPPLGRCAQVGEQGYFEFFVFEGGNAGGFSTTASPIVGINGQQVSGFNTFPGLGFGGGSCTMSPSGSISMGTFPAGTTLTLQCPLGSSVAGSLVATCINGQWSQMGSCTQPGITSILRIQALHAYCVSFGSLERTSIADGEVRYSNGMDGRASLGTVARVNCSLGYRLEGAPAAVCTSGGWQPRGIGRCVIDIGEYRGVSSCQGAPLVLNGQVQYSSNYPYQIGSYARLLCNPGYANYGDGTLTCISGLWSPQSFGQCVMGGTPGIGGVTFPQTTQPWTTTSPWTTNPWTTTTQVQLFSNVPLLGGGSCLIPPLTPFQGTLKYSSGNVVGPWNEGVIVALICNNGYYVVGAGAASCRSGSFSPSQLGSCASSIGASRLPCAAPLTPLNGQFNFSSAALPTGGYPDGAMAALFCQQSMVPYISTCSNALWSPSIPVSCFGIQRDSLQRDSPPGSSLDCPSLRAPPFGDITFSLPSDPSTPNRYPASTRGVLVCTSGSSLEGNNVTTCTDGVFSPPLGMCV